MVLRKTSTLRYEINLFQFLLDRREGLHILRREREEMSELIVNIPDEGYKLLKSGKSIRLHLKPENQIYEVELNEHTPDVEEYQKAFEDIKAEIRQKQWHIGVDSANQVIEIINKYTGGQNDQS